MLLRHVGDFELRTNKAQKIQEELSTFPFTVYKILDRETITKENYKECELGVIGIVN